MTAATSAGVQTERLAQLGEHLLLALAHRTALKPMKPPSLAASAARWAHSSSRFAEGLGLGRVGLLGGDLAGSGDLVEDLLDPRGAAGLEVADRVVALLRLLADILGDGADEVVALRGQLR